MTALICGNGEILRIHKYYVQLSTVIGDLNLSPIHRKSCTYTNTYPSTLFSDPFGYSLLIYKLADEWDDFAKEAPYPRLEDLHRYSIAETEQGYDSAPGDDTVME